MNINEKMKLHKWAQYIAEQQSSGLSQTQWCKMKGTSNHIPISMQESKHGNGRKNAGIQLETVSQSRVDSEN